MLSLRVLMGQLLRFHQLFAGKRHPKIVRFLQDVLVGMRGKEPCATRIVVSTEVDGKHLGLLAIRIVLVDTKI